MFPMVLAALGPTEWLLVFAVILLFFGAAKIPDLARAMGRAKGEFEKGSREGRVAKEDKPMESVEEAKILKAARELGIPTDGRSVADIKADVRAKLG